MGSRIYITHCSAQKDDRLRNLGWDVYPADLYTSVRVQRFIHSCKAVCATWAIFSDLYGVWFPDVKHPWYDKSPDAISSHEFRALVDDFDRKLADYDELYYYRNPARFHSLYRRLIQVSSLSARVRLISHWWEITGPEAR